MPGATRTLALCGDVMLGRGVDQVLPHPGDPALREETVHDAGTYVRLAEAAHGTIPKPVEPAYPWGVALDLRAGADAFVLNLETSVTTSGDFAPGKAVHYRMHPANLPCLTAARPDVVALANNHVLDFGTAGLLETLDTLSAAGLTTCGAGRDADDARRPAVVRLPDGGRLVVLSVGSPTSGVPASWAAAPDRPGVDVLPRHADPADLLDRVRRVRRPGDVVVVSVHWGSNWGYDVSRAERRLARALVDGGVDVVHGHSSHHPRPVEVYRGRLVLYGCGDFVDDYEGITGYEQYRDDLRVLYLATLDAASGELVDLRMPVLQARRMRLEHASREDTRWLGAVLDRVSRPLGTRIRAGTGPELVLAEHPD